MSKKQTKRGRGLVDREVIWLAATALVIGVFFGFLIGRRSAVVSKPRWEKPAVQEKVQKREAPREVKAVKSSGFAGWFKKAKKPRIAIVIDDVGNRRSTEDLIKQLPRSVTLAILPNLANSQYFSEMANKEGFNFILHQPMEPLRAVEDPDPGMIYVRMSDSEIVNTIDQNLKTVPKAMGMNNHRGSLATQDRRVMRIVLSELKKRGMFFLDSATTPLSVASEEARKLKVSYLRRSVFLDNELEPDYIHEQFDHLIKTARREGVAVGIGHDKANTLIVLGEELQRLESQGIELVSLKELL